MSERARLEFNGEVVEDSNGKFKVKVDNQDNFFVLCTLSGKIRENSIRILPGDKVLIEVSEYDTTRGRIKSRFKTS